MSEQKRMKFVAKTKGLTTYDTQLMELQHQLQQARDRIAELEVDNKSLQRTGELQHEELEQLHARIADQDAEIAKLNRRLKLSNTPSPPRDSPREAG